MPPISPLTHAKFSLSIWGVAGIFGGEEAISSMALIPLHQGKRWLGWYNTPGSLKLARYFGHLVQSSPFWKQLFPYAGESPAVLLDVDGEKGPRYTASLSGTEMETGHLGYLVIDRCKEIAKETVVEGRRTSPIPVVFIDLANVPETLDKSVPRLSSFVFTFPALIPIIISVVACIMCATAYDWYSFSVIVFGIITNGIASIVIGLEKLELELPKAALGSPDGDGVLICDEIVVVVKGAEDAVNVITKGKFVLKHPGGFIQLVMGTCLLLIIDFLAQLVLIPQASLFGQLMFVISICVSWIYAFYVSSIRRAKIQGDVLFQVLRDPPISKFRLGTRTAAAFFATLLVYRGVFSPSHASVERTLRAFIPNKTIVWDKWMEKAVRQVCDNSLTCLELDASDAGLPESEKELLNTLLDDASMAYKGYNLHYAKKD